MDGKNTILVVDDEPHMLKSIKRMLLMDSRYQVVTEQSATKVLAKYKNLFPQLVISDYKMPEIDGLSFIQKTRKLWPESVFIMLTGHPSLHLSLDAINNGGIFRLLVKPVEQKTLLQAIADGFELSRFNERLNDLDQLDSLNEKEIRLEKVVAETRHELKNQLLVVGLSSKLAMKQLHENDLDSTYANLERINNGIEKMSYLLQGLKKMSAPSEEKFTDINLSIQEIINFLEPINQFDKIKFRLEPDEGLPLLLINSMQIHQVLTNLYLNASQAMEKGVISTRISHDPTSQRVVIMVQDNGPGISSAIKDKVFNPNFTTKKEGAGVGLHISKRIIEEIGGSLTLKNSSAKGACFVIEIPLKGSERDD